MSSAAGPINASNPYNVGALQDVAINNLRCSWVQPAGPPPQRPSPANASPANASLLRAQDVQVGMPPCRAATDSRKPLAVVASACVLGFVATWGPSSASSAPRASDSGLSVHSVLPPQVEYTPIEYVGQDIAGTFTQFLVR